MAKNVDLLKLFGIEGKATLKTLTTETKHDVEGKTPNEAGEELKPLLDELRVRAVSGDVIGMEACLKAMQLRMDYMFWAMNELKKMTGHK